MANTQLSLTTPQSTVQIPRGQSVQIPFTIHGIPSQSLGWWDAGYYRAPSPFSGAFPDESVNNSYGAYILSGDATDTVTVHAPSAAGQGASWTVQAHGHNEDFSEQWYASVTIYLESVPLPGEPQ